MCAIGGCSTYPVPVPESALDTLSGWSSTVRTNHALRFVRFVAPLPDGLEEGAGPRS